MLGRISSEPFTGFRPVLRRPSGWRSPTRPGAASAGAVRSPWPRAKENFLIAEQLQAARAAHWRQQQNPLLTLEDAEGWLAQHPLCLYLPRQAQLPAPAPSFVEACMGGRHATPPPAAIAQAQELLTRLIGSGAVVPLNLLGAVGEQPDFLAHRDALPYVLSLRADPDWKHAPQKSSGHKVSPLVLGLWKVLEKEGVLGAAEARETLGRELTEAAVLRALCELWQALRISPHYADPGQPTRWEMLRVRHREALATAGSTGQVTALSLLVSMYLQSVYAATGEEIEIFLSPVASRSRVREAVRGLSATRQIHALSMDAQTYHFLEDGLPAFAEPAAAADLAPPLAPAAPAPPNQRPGAGPRPEPRKVQATKPANQPASPAAAAPPSARSTPIFRRAKPGPVPPAARTDRPVPPSRPPWRPAAKTPATGQPARWAAKQGGTRPPARSGARPPARPREARAGEARPDARASGRPNARGPARPAGRPGPFTKTRTGTGGGGRNQPPAKPWALPGRPSSTPSRPPRAPAGRPGPFTKTRTGTGGGGRNQPAAKPWALPGRPSSTPSRPPRAPAGRPGPFTKARTGTGGGGRNQPAAKPWALPGRPSGTPSRPPRAGGRGDAPFRGPQKRRDRPRDSGPGSPGRGSSFRPQGRPPGRRQDPPRTPSIPAAGPPAERPAFPSRPRESGGGPARGSRPGGAKPPRFDAPFRKASGPAKSWPRGGGTAGKSGKPPASFRGRKPDRKKPGA
jgi:23S rRNA pseudouridine2605 synthase